MAIDCKILVVEDNEQSAKLIKEIIEEHFSIRIVGSGEEALQAIPEFSPDIILLDRMLPGISGDEVIREILAKPDLKDVKIVMISSMITTNDIQSGFFAGADYYLPKPFDHDQLLSLINRIISSKYESL
jgi:DNA-binding response OmpR family regulator